MPGFVPDDVNGGGPTVDSYHTQFLDAEDSMLSTELEEHTEGCVCVCVCVLSGIKITACRLICKCRPKYLNVRHTV